jgi:hypothetical protein
MKRFANLLKRFSLHDAQREATRGLTRHAENIKIEIRHELEEMEIENGLREGRKREIRQWSTETDPSHWTY